MQTPLKIIRVLTVNLFVKAGMFRVERRHQRKFLVKKEIPLAKKIRLLLNANFIAFIKS